MFEPLFQLRLREKFYSETTMYYSTEREETLLHLRSLDIVQIGRLISEVELSFFTHPGNPKRHE